MEHQQSISSFLEELKASGPAQDDCEHDETAPEIRDVPIEWADNRAVDAEQTITKRLDFVQESKLFGQKEHCPCSFPRSRFDAINKPLHVLIPICGYLAKSRDAICWKHAPPLSTATWEPPRWSKMPMVHVGISWPSKLKSRPRLTGKTARRVLDNAEGLEAAKVGDITQARTLLDSGKCRIDDIGSLTMYTMLLWAVIKRQAKMVEFLIQNGADPYYDSLGSQPSPCHLAWDLWLRGLITEEEEHFMSPLLDKSNLVDLLDLPPLQQIILDLSSESFDNELLSDPDAIHHEDLQERTALSWAAARGCRIYVSKILQRGADPNLPDKHNKTPLYLAVEYQREHTFDVVSLLLNAGADTDPVLSFPERSSPLLCAASNVDELCVLHLLLRCGANINAKNRYGQTALHIVARNKPAEHTAVLLSFGATVHVKDPNGQTPVDIAIKHDNIEVIRLFTILFHPSRPPNPYTEDTVRVFFKNIVAIWWMTEADPPDFLPDPGTSYCGPQRIGPHKVTTADLKKVAKQLRRLIEIPPGSSFDEFLRTVGYSGTTRPVLNDIDSVERGQESKETTELDGIDE